MCLGARTAGKVAPNGISVPAAALGPLCMGDRAL